MKKYHSLAAKGETVDLNTLEEDQQAQTAIDIQQAQPPNEAVNATTVKHSQTVAGATPTTQPETAVPVTPVAAGSVPASTSQPGAGAGAGGMPVPVSVPVLVLMRVSVVVVWSSRWRKPRWSGLLRGWE